MSRKDYGFVKHAFYRVEFMFDNEAYLKFMKKNFSQYHASPRLAAKTENFNYIPK